MTGIPKRGTSMKQMAYARRVFAGQGENKKQIALDCGYSPNVANSVSSHIENKPGFNNAMARLAMDSNNLALAAMHEFKARGFEDFSNKDLVGALNAIGSAWSKFNAPARDPNAPASTNRLRTVILQQIENQTITTGNDAPPVSTPEPIIETSNEQEPVL
jgi:hypothetical protein